MILIQVLSPLNSSKNSSGKTESRHMKFQQSCNAIVFNPAKMIATQTDELHKKVKSLLTKFINLNILTPTLYDQILKEYKEFLRNDIVFSREKFSNYDKQKDRLDTFFFSLPAIKKYVNLAFVIKMILTLSHGQAVVERSFSVNKSVVYVNMKEESTVACKTTIE